MDEDKVKTELGMMVYYQLMLMAAMKQDCQECIEEYQNLIARQQKLFTDRHYTFESRITGDPKMYWYLLRTPETQLGEGHSASSIANWLDAKPVLCVTHHPETYEFNDE